MFPVDRILSVFVFEVLLASMMTVFSAKHILCPFIPVVILIKTCNVNFVFFA